MKPSRPAPTTDRRTVRPPPPRRASRGGGADMLKAMPTRAEYDAMSEEELLARANRFQLDADGVASEPELLGEFTIEEALEMGAFFEDPAEQAAFERAVEARGLRLP